MTINDNLMTINAPFYDSYFHPDQRHPVIRCDSGRVVFVEKATHWVQHEETDLVNGLINGLGG